MPKWESYCITSTRPCIYQRKLTPYCIPQWLGLVVSKGFLDTASSNFNCEILRPKIQAVIYFSRDQDLTARTNIKTQLGVCFVVLCNYEHYCPLAAAEDPLKSFFVYNTRLRGITRMTA
jgi:hypothetical protein